MKRIIIYLLAFSLVSCEGILNDKKIKELDNKADQSRIDNLFTDISKENYSNRVSDISGIYGERLNTIGLRSGNTEYILDKVYQVQPKTVEAASEIRKDIKEFNARTRQIKAKNKDISAFDVLLQSEQADTGFSKIEKSFLQEAQTIFDTEDEEASYYIAKLENLEKEYHTNYELTDKEFTTIVGIAQSVGTFITTLKESEDELAHYLHTNGEINKATVFPLPYVLFQTSGEDDDGSYVGEQYTGEDGCSFEADWGEVVGAATLGAAGGLLGSTTYLAGAAATGSIFGPPGAAVSAAGTFAWGGIWGIGFGASMELIEQYDAHKVYIKKTCK